MRPRVPCSSARTWSRTRRRSPTCSAAIPRGPGRAGRTSTAGSTPARIVLRGPYAHAYSDLDDDNEFSAAEEIQRTLAGDFRFPFQPFAGSTCDPHALCSWDANFVESWQDNREQNGVQAFYLVNRFRDHLANDPQIRLQRLRRRRRRARRDRRRRRQRPGPRPPQQREHDHAARRAWRRGCSCTCSTATASAPSTAATRPRSSGTSTRTGSPTAWSSTTTARARCRARRRARWARGGATGTRSTCSSATA